MDDTTNRCRMFKNQLDLLLDKFEVYSKATTKKSIRELTLFFSHTARSMQTHLRQEVTLWRSILWKTKTDTLSTNVRSRTRLRLIHIPSLTIRISMKGLNFLVPVKEEKTIFIMLSSTSFFPRASHVIVNGGVFSIIGNMVTKQTGEWIHSNLPEWKILMASLNMHRIAWE